MNLNNTNQNNIESCGLIAIIGRPNVGKSTLLNHIIGEKISITSAKPQTTRHKILGVKTIDTKQAIYVDTPGIHLNNQKAINKYMNKTARTATEDVDLIIFVVEAGYWTKEDQTVLTLLQNILAKQALKVYLVINKVDLISDKTKLLTFMADLAKQLAFTEIIPVSALNGDQVAKLEQQILLNLPVGPHLFPNEMKTDRQLQFRITEIIREKLMRNLGKELPYAVAVEIEKMAQEAEQTVIHAVIWVERSSQKAIVIGAQGSKLKVVGSAARQEIKQLLNCRVHLQLWVKVRECWADNVKALAALGYA